MDAPKYKEVDSVHYDSRIAELSEEYSIPYDEAELMVKACLQYEPGYLVDYYEKQKGERDERAGGNGPHEGINPRDESSIGKTSD